MAPFRVLLLVLVLLVSAGMAEDWDTDRNPNNDNGLVAPVETHTAQYLRSLQEESAADEEEEERCDPEEQNQQVAQQSGWWSSLASQLVGWHSREQIVLAFDWDTIRAALQDFINLANHVLSMIASFIDWLTDWFKTYDQLAIEAEELYLELDTDVRELVHRRKSIESMCLHPADEEARSQCIHTVMDVTDALNQARRERSKARKAYERYKTLAAQEEEEKMESKEDMVVT